MKHYEATALIDATPERIWALLTDGANYANWDNGVVKVDGQIAPDQKLTVVSAANPKRAFPVKVTHFEPSRAMTWSGGMPLGLFKGVRTFALTRENGATRFDVREEYSGPLLGLIWRSMPDLQPSFDQFADGLKRKAETLRG